MFNGGHTITDSFCACLVRFIKLRNACVDSAGLNIRSLLSSWVCVDNIKRSQFGVARLELGKCEYASEHVRRGFEAGSVE